MPLKLLHPLRTALVCLMPLVAAAVRAQATIHVGPGQAYTTIQSGINAAANGDTVLVAPGTYYEHVNFNGKAVTVMSANGAGATIIDGSGTGTAVLMGSPNASPMAVLEGFTIQHGYPGGDGSLAEYNYGGAVVADGNSIIRNNTIVNNTSCGVDVLDGNVTVQYNSITNNVGANTAGGDCRVNGYGILAHDNTVSRTSINLTNNIIQGNHDGGINVFNLDASTTVNITQNHIQSNGLTQSFSGGGSGVVIGDFAVTNVVGNLITGNGGPGVYQFLNTAITLVNNTVYLNSLMYTPQYTYEGTELQLGTVDTTATLSNNIVVGNQKLYPVVSCPTVSTFGDDYSWDHNIIYNTVSGTGSIPCFADPTGINLYVDPKVNSGPTGNYNLALGSPAIDAGNNNAPLITSLDLNGTDRILDAKGHGCIIDIGAFEADGTVTDCGMKETLTSSVNPSNYGQSVTFTAQLTSTKGVPTGDVQFADGGTVLGTETISGNGVSSFTTSSLTSGSHSITATYQPTGTFSATSASLTQVVNPIPVTAVLTVSPSTVNAGSIVALTATIAPVLPYMGVPTGTVNFFANGVPIGIEQMSNGVAVLNTSTLPAGTDTITCTYVGLTGFGSATCNAVPVTVIGPPTLALTITTVGGGAQAVSTVAAQTPVALVATVAANGTAVTAGQVNFCDATAAHCTDIHLLGTAQLNSSGVAVLRFVPGLGSHRYKAVLAATKAFGAATSNTAALAVTGKVASSTVLVATGVQGDYTLTATVTGDSAAFPTGTVPFLDTTNANASLGSATLVSGTRTRSFASPTLLSTGSNPINIAEGDFNNDGKTDIAVINEGSSLQIFLGNGDGTFAAGMTVSTSFTSGYDAYVLVADFNDDGNADIAVANRGNANLFIFLGNGDGTFTAAASPGVSAGSEGMATGDFNGDGIVDLAVGNQGSNSISILLGKGDGTFTAAPGIPTQYAAFFLAVGDFNGDGKADLAATSIYSSDVFILLGNGDGTFTAGSSITGVPNSYSVTTADFNGDGKIDLAVTSGDYGNPFVYLGKGDGTFTQAGSSSIADSGTGISVGDFNQDGIPDLVVSEYDGKTLDVFLGNGDGTFGSPSQLITSGQSTSTAIADFDGNGLPDIATANFHSSSAQVFLNEVSSTATATITNVVPVGVGTHYAEASYAGDVIYNPSVSNLVPLIAGLPPTTTVASVSPNPSTYGQPVVFSVHVAPVTANASVPSGKVVFTFCRGAQDTVTLDANGNGSFIYPPPGNTNVVAEPVGSCAFTAAYQGDAMFAPSTSSAVAYVVVPAPSTTAVVGAPNPAYQGQMVTLTATITGVPSPTANPVTGLPIPPAQTPGTGMVQFFDSATSIGSAAVNASNQAVLPTSSFAVGTHAITAVYSGDANLGGSTSGIYNEVVLPSTFTIALSPTTITLAAGQPGSVSVQLTSVGLFAGPLSLTYGALPMYATAKITPGTVTLVAGGTGSATFALNTVVKAESVVPVRPGSRGLPGVFAAVMLLVLPWVRGRKRLARLMAVGLFAVVLQGMTGCTNLSYVLSTVAPGTYAVPITATDANGNAMSAVLTVVVTP